MKVESPRKILRRDEPPEVAVKTNKGSDRPNWRRTESSETVEKQREPVETSVVEHPFAKIDVPIAPSESKKEVRIWEEKKYVESSVPLKDQDIDALVRRILNASVEVTSKELLQLAPELKVKIKNLLTRNRFFEVPTREVNRVEILLDDGIPINEVNNNNTDRLKTEDLPQARVSTLTQSKGQMKQGDLVVSDPYSMYLGSLAQNESPKKLVVARESHALKVVRPLVNGEARIECILDPGSQIVSMNESLAKTANISWDPEVFIHVESANGGLDRSCGIARNVPFNFGNITVFLQVHVIRNVAYDVLLGRPFDVITQSKVKNERDGSQTITLTDPNDPHAKIEIPTFDRSKRRILDREPESTFFRPSLRN